MRKLRVKAATIVTAVVLMLAGGVYGLVLSRKAKPLGSAALGDGRIIHIEGVTYGTHPSIGWESPLTERLGPWLPKKLVDGLKPKRPHSEFSLDKPGLVVWVNATDAATGKHVDCQGLRMEFVDSSGDLFGTETSSWSGGSSFWREGHVFLVYPRTERQLALRIVPWGKGQSATVTFPNPHVTAAVPMSGKPPPQQKEVADLEILLGRLTLKTNGSPENYWQTPCQYWEPELQLRRNGRTVPGWDEAEWTCEDPVGNRGRFLGTHQPVLRFEGTFYPSATNQAAALLITNSPAVDMGSLQSNAVWNFQAQFDSQPITLLGMFPPGSHIFCEGSYQTNPPAGMRPPTGSPPSGWFSQSQRVTPLLRRVWYGHYTPQPVIYLRAPRLGGDIRIGVRLRDEQGRTWLAKPEPQGSQDSIWPYLVELPPEAKTVISEVVVLKPVRAAFDVATR